VLDDLLRQRPVLWRVDRGADARPHYRDRPPAGGKGSLVRRSVDAAGQAGQDSHVVASKLGR